MGEEIIRFKIIEIGRKEAGGGKGGGTRGKRSGAAAGIFRGWPVAR